MNNIVLHAVAGAVAWIRTHVAAITWVSRPALNPPRYKSTPVARQTEFDPAPTTLFPLFYFWVVPVRLGRLLLPALTPHRSLPRPPILARLDPHTSCLVHLGPQSWFALAPDRDPPWPTILAPLDLLWVSTQKFQARKCSTISLQSTQALLTPIVAGAVTGIRTHVAAIAWVSRPALNPPRHKGTPAARQTESDPTPTTLFPRFCPFFCRSSSTLWVKGRPLCEALDSGIKVSATALVGLIWRSSLQ